MGRSHAWLPRGQELIEPRPRNWGDNLSLVGAMRLEGWVTLATAWGAITTPRFVAWVRRHLVRHLRPATSWYSTTSRRTRPRASGR